MPILDKIKEAESIAEEIRAKAKQDVSIILEEVVKNNTVTTEKMIEDAKNEIKKLNEENSKMLLEMEVNSKLNIEFNANISKQLANTHLDEIVDFILKKVIDS